MQTISKVKRGRNLSLVFHNNRFTPIEKEAGLLGRTYLISDIHGEYRKLLNMLRVIDFREEDTLYIIGDVVDRGEEPIEIIEWVMNTPNVHLLRGNHESMFLDYLNTPEGAEKDIALQMWSRNGGLTTYEGYQKRSREQKERIKEFVEGLPYYKILGNVLLVHSGVDVVKTKELFSLEEIMKRQDENALLWSRSEFYGFKAIQGVKIFFGHTPTASIQQSLGEPVSSPMTIWHDKVYGDKICIDCGAVFSKYGGRLACICLETMKEYYV